MATDTKDFTEFDEDELLETVEFHEDEGRLELAEIDLSAGDEFYDPKTDQTFRIREIRPAENNDVSVVDIKIEYEDGRRMELDEGSFAYGLTDGRSRSEIEMFGWTRPNPWIVPLELKEEFYKEDPNTY